MTYRRGLAGAGLVLLGWMLVQAGWWGLMGLTAHELRKTNSLEMARLTSLSSRLSTLTQVYPYLSLGSYRLDALYTPYFTLVTVAEALETGLELVEAGQSTLPMLLAGESTDWEKWQRIPALAAELTPHLDTLAARIGDHRIQVLASQVALVAEYETGLYHLLGYDRPKHYVVLMQNNMELRPTGGFLGSYADFWLNQGALQHLTIQDIYVPDGQIKGYVKEPGPISKHLFGGDTPGWRLRDSNWDPDFMVAAKQMKWFFEEGELEPIDGFIGINLSFIEAVLHVIGPLDMPDYNLMVTRDTFYQHAQYAAEHEFFPGSTQKGDFLRAVGRALVTKLLTGSDETLTGFAPVIYTQLEQQEVTVALFDEQAQSLFEMNGWDGKLQGYEGDYLFVNEANLGINKTNCCIERLVTDKVRINGQEVTHELQLEYVNRNPPVPKPPESWGGGYKNYVRVLVPANATLGEIVVNGEIVSNDEIDIYPLEHHVGFGFLILIEGGQQGLARVRWSLPTPDKKPYSLLVQKQPGTGIVPYVVEFFGQRQERLEFGLTRNLIL
jgi:hypothetical protein